MKSISAKELKNRTGDVLRRVGRGEKVLVTKRGRPCAVISPVGEEQDATMDLRPYETAWADIQKTLGVAKARHKSWEDAIRWSRSRHRASIIDTPVFVIDLRYKRDRNFATNRRFLDRIAQEGYGATTIYNLLEVCGILAFNLNQSQLKELFHYFPKHYHLEVLPHSTFESPLPALKTGDLFDIVSMKTGLGDALIIGAVEQHIPGAARFVSWNARHFRGRFSIPALTPREFLDQFP